MIKHIVMWKFKENTEKEMNEFLDGLKALENQIAGNGFSFVECLSGCPTNWRTNNVKTWEFIEKQMPEFFKVGELRTPEKKED